MQGESKGSSWVHSWRIQNQSQLMWSIINHPHYHNFCHLHHRRSKVHLNLEYSRSSTSRVTAGLLRQTCERKNDDDDDCDHPHLGRRWQKDWPKSNAHHNMVEAEPVVDILLAVAVILLPLAVPVPEHHQLETHIHLRLRIPISLFLSIILSQ